MHRGLVECLEKSLERSETITNGTLRQPSDHNSKNNYTAMGSNRFQVGEMLKAEKERRIKNCSNKFCWAADMPEPGQAIIEHFERKKKKFM